MNNIIKDVNYILETNGNLDNEFGELSKIYLMTTENIKAFLQQYDLCDKDILTVAGSGDQMLNAYLMGARNVTCFDINPLAFYQVKLKKAAVCALSYQEFLEFFFHDYNKVFDRNLFDKISKKLDDDTVDFFNSLFNKYDSNQIINKIYYRFTPDLKQMQRMNSYLDLDNYNKLSSILENKDVSFIHSNITELKNKIMTNTYDMILFSNISDSIENIWGKDCLKSFKRLIHSLSRNLNKDGIIQVGYIYDYYYGRDHNPFKDKKLRQSIFTTDEFYSTFVESYRLHSASDAIITYQKVKRNR